MERKDQWRRKGMRRRRWRWREGIGLRYITRRHGAEAHNGVLIKKSILGRAELSKAFAGRRVQVGMLSREIGKAALSASLQ